jgi:hypothetical protein
VHVLGWHDPSIDTERAAPLDGAHGIAQALEVFGQDRLRAVREGHGEEE